MPRLISKEIESRRVRLIAMSPYAKQGRVFVIAYLVCQITMIVIVVALTLMKQQDVVKNLCKAAASAFLIYELWCGSKWAKWFHAVSFFLAAGWCGYACVVFPDELVKLKELVFFILVPLGLFLLSLSYAFAFSRSVNEFLAYQRGDSTESDLDAIVTRAKSGNSKEVIEWDFLNETEPPN